MSNFLYGNIIRRNRGKTLPYNSPIPLTISGLAVWFSPRQVKRSDGDFLDYIIDFSQTGSTGYQYESSKRLIFRTNQTPNGKSAIEGSSGKFAKFNFDTTGNSGFTFFIVSKYSISANAQQEILLGSGGAGGTSGIRWGLTSDFNTSTTSQRLGWAGTSAGVSLGTLTDPTTWKVRIFTKSSTVWNVYENGTLVSGPISDSSMPSGIYNGVLGAEQASNYYYRGFMSDVGVYKKVLSTSEISSLNAYLMSENGIS